MFRASDNAPLLIEAFCNACVECEAGGLAVPDIGLINRVLAGQDAGHEIRPPYLVATRVYAPIEVPTLYMADQARPLIEESLAASERLMNEGQGRRAVQETLWQLETVVTAFRGTGTEESTVQGKYFVIIVKEMKAKGP